MVACQPNSNEVVPNQQTAQINMSDFYVYTNVDASKASTKSTGETSDAMKDTSQRDWDITDSAHNSNLWVCEIGGGILDYAQFSGGALATDGVVIGSDFLGKNTAGGQYAHSRTATHEIGHWLNLRHIWGNGSCV